MGMIWDLLALQWVAVGACGLMGAGIVAAFALELVGEARRPRYIAWHAGGPQYPQTLPPDTRPLVLGMTAGQVEDEIARMIAANPDRPA